MIMLPSCADGVVKDKADRNQSRRSGVSRSASEARIVHVFARCSRRCAAWEPLRQIGVLK
jgi:hypothetical protein